MKSILFFSNRPQLTLVILTFFVLVWKIPQLIFHPNELLLTSDGDGLKSYFSFIYHLQYDQSFLHFGGMNFPHGEHYLFTDGFPALAWFLQLFPFLKDDGILILHLSIILSLLLTPLFIFLILKKFEVEDWISILGALSIFMLQPQFPRLFSHLSLSYSIFFPLSWYLLLRFKENSPSIKWFIALIINQLFWYFMHPYLGFMVTIFYGIDWFMEQVKKGVPIQERLLKFIPIIIPITVVQLLLKLTDSIVDRPTTPYGFFDYQAHWKSIFLPNAGPIYQWISNRLSLEEFRWEGYAYIGFLSILMTFVGIFLLMWRIWKKQTKQTSIPKPFIPAIGAACFLLILSFGYPFNGNPHWLEYIPFLKQFRALGRFSWVFYYVIGVLGIYLLNQLYIRFRTLESQHHFKYKSRILVLGLLLLQLSEGNSLLNVPSSFSSNLFDARNLSSSEKQLIEAAKKSNSFVKAILPLPWFHIGSEIYGKEADPSTLRTTFLLSAHTGIPIYAVMLGRTSKQQTLDYFHFFQDGKKNTLKTFYPLLVYRNEGVTLYQEDEQKIANQAKKCYANNSGNLSILTTNRMNAVDPTEASQIWSDEFSDKETWGELITNGRYRGKIENYNTILRLDSSQISPKEWYEISFDYYPDWNKPISNVCYVEYKDPKTKQVNWFYGRSVGAFPGIYKDHIHASIRFQAQSFPCEYHCFFIGKSTNVYFEVDHLKVHKLSPRK